MSGGSEGAGGAPRRGRWRRGLLGAGAALVLGVALGPRPDFEERWASVALGTDWEDQLAASEAATPGLRPGDEAEVAWLDSTTKAPTPLGLVYLHGFSADRHEVEPLITRLGAELGANVFFARLTGHGRDGPAMADATVEDWLDDTSYAYAVGRRIGERVVFVGTSTGGTLATWAASRDESDDLAALVLISPNFHPTDRSSRVLLWPWGGQLARLVVGAERCFEPENEDQERHWTVCYPISSLRPMMALVEHVRTMDLTRIEVPTLVLYSRSDRVVDAVETEVAVEKMTGADVTVVRFDGSGDPAQHILAGDIVSPGSTDEVVALIADYLAGLVGGGG